MKFGFRKVTNTFDISLRTDRRASRLSALLAIAFLLGCAAVLGWLKYLTPWQFDDLVYALPWRSYFLSDGPAPTWHEMWESIVNQTLTANGRFGDKFVVPMLMMVPGWLYAVATGLAVLAMFYMGCRLAFGPVSRYPWRWVLLCSAYFLLLPWAQYELLVNMVLNYTFGSVFALLAFYCLVRGDERKRPRWYLWVAFLSALFAGWWHEEFGFAFGPAIFLYLLMTRGWKQPVSRLVFIGVCAGFLLLVAAPGFWVRIGNFVYEEGYNPSRIPTLIKGVNFLLLLPLLGVVGLACKRVRGWLGSRLWALVAAFTVAFGFTLILYWNSLPFMRLFWYFDVLGIALLGMLAQRILGGRHHLWVKILAWCAIAFVAAHSVATIRWQKIITREFQDIVKLYHDSPDGVVYYDHHTNGFGPWLTLRKARIYAFTHEAREYGVPQFYDKPEGYKPLSIVPTALRNLDPAKVQGEGLVKCYKGYFICQRGNGRIGM